MTGPENKGISSDREILTGESALKHYHVIHLKTSNIQDFSKKNLEILNFCHTVFGKAYNV